MDSPTRKKFNLDVINVFKKIKKSGGSSSPDFNKIVQGDNIDPEVLKGMYHSIFGAKIHRGDASSGLTKEEFCEAFEGLFATGSSVAKLFDLMDRDKNNRVSFKEVIATLSMYNKQSTENKLQFLFDVYDDDSSGFLEGNEITNIVNHMLSGAISAGREQKSCENFIDAIIDKFDIKKNKAISRKLWIEVGLRTPSLIQLLLPPTNELLSRDWGSLYSAVSRSAEFLVDPFLLICRKGDFSHVFDYISPRNEDDILQIISCIDEGGHTPIYYAASYGSIEFCELCIKHNVDLNLQTYREKTSPLHVAAENGHLEVVKLLVENKANIDCLDYRKWTPLTRALVSEKDDELKGRRAKVVNYLLDSGTDLSVEDVEGADTLATASRYGLVEHITGFVQRGKNVDISHSNEDGFTALHWAIPTNQSGSVSKLIQLGININARTKSGQSALFLAAYYSHFNCCRELLEMGANPLLSNNQGKTPLHIAAQEQAYKIIKLFLHNSSDAAELKDCEGKKPIDYIPVSEQPQKKHRLKKRSFSKSESAENCRLLLQQDIKESPLISELLIAFRMGNIKVVWSLLKKHEPQIDVDSFNKNGTTLMMYCAIQDTPDILQWLLYRKAKINLINNHGTTAFHKCVQYGHVECTELLLAHPETNINIQDRDGVTPLHRALAEQGKNERGKKQENIYKTIELLLDSPKLKINLSDLKGMHPIHYCARYGLIKYLPRLVQLGADINKADNNGVTVVGYSVLFNHIPIIKVLHEFGADFYPTTNQGETLLHLATANGSLDSIVYLIDNVYNSAGKVKEMLTKTDPCGRFPLHLAASYGNSKIVTILLSKMEPKDVDHIDNDGDTVLHHSATFEVTKLLLPFVDNSIENKAGFTPLMSAAKNGRMGTVEALIEYGVPLSNNRNINIIYLASEVGHTGCVQELLRAGCQFDEELYTKSDMPPSLRFQNPHPPEEIYPVVLDGTPQDLVTYLMHESYFDPKYVDTFFSVYMLWFKELELLSLILQRLDSHFSQPLIQKRCFSVLSFWMKGRQHDFCVPHMRKKLFSFFGKYSAKSENKPEELFAPSLRQTVLNFFAELESFQKTLIDMTKKSPLNRLSSVFLCPPKNIDFYSFPHKTIAEQITVIEFEIFKNILPTELMNQRWNKKQSSTHAPNVLQLIQRFNNVSAWVSTEIVSEQKLKNRAARLKYFIKMGEQLLLLNNFNSLMAVLCSLESSSISRLKKSWALLSEKTKGRFNRIQQTMKSEKNFKEYRKTIASVSGSTIPFLGIYLTDLTFCDEGNESVFTRPICKPDGIKGEEIEVVNFEKARMEAEIFKKIQNYQFIPYSTLKNEQQISLSLMLISGLDQKALYQKSLEIEPRKPQ